MKPVFWIAFVSLESRVALSFFHCGIVKVRATTIEKAKESALDRAKFLGYKPRSVVQIFRLSEFDESSMITIGR